MKSIDTDICIIGAGPNGLTLTMELAARGNKVTVLEMRTETESTSPRSNHVSARSMEIYRRLGLADEIRAQGMPDDFPNDGVYATRFDGFELCRFRMPCRRDRFNDSGYDDGDLPSRERAARVSQMYLAPVLERHVLKFPNVQVLNGTKFESLQDDGGSITVQARCRANGEPLVVRSKFLVGADGGRSDVRKALGIRMIGEDNLLRARSRLFRAPNLLDRCGYPKAWMHWFYLSGKWSSMIAIDGRELWLVHNFIPPSMPFEDFDIDKGLRETLAVGAEFQYETIRDEDWVGRRLVADKLRVGRCFIVGDAAHMWIPYGGYGMNAGIADSDNLAWMLDAVLKGWAPESLLDAHERERWPVIDRTSRFAAEFVEVLKDHETVLIEEDSAEGARLRKRFGDRIYAANIGSMVPKGLNFGYFYDDSPIIVYDDSKPPPYSMGEYVPSTVPGCRVPHFCLRDGRSLYDALGGGYTLLRFDRTVDVSALQGAAQAARVPLSILDVESGKDFDSAVYQHTLILVRPDQHIAWRGNRLPADTGELVNRIRGAANTSKAKSA